MHVRTLAACSVALACLLAAADATASGAPAFRPATQLSPPLPHPNYLDPGLAFRDGRTVAVWTKSRFADGSWTQATVLDAAGNGGPVTSVVASPDAGFVNDPVAAWSSAGRVAVVWAGWGIWLSMLDADLAPAPSKLVGTGRDPVVAYPDAGDGLIAWDGSDGIGLAPITPSGQVGATSTIPSPQGYAWEPRIEFDRNGGHVYFLSGGGVLDASVTAAGEPGSVRELLPPLGEDRYYRSLVVSGDLLVVLEQRLRGRRLVCVPLSGSGSEVIDSGSIRIGSIDVDAAAGDGLIGWAKTVGRKGSRVARAATVDRRCRASRTVALPGPGRRSYDVSVGHDGRSPLALVAGGGGLEAVGLSRSGEVRGSERVRRTRPFSKKFDQRTPVTGLQLLTAPGSRPTAVWTQSHRGPGETIAASVAR